MLVLSRRHDESICIGQDIVVTVISIRGDKVRLGIVAPQHTQVDREEIRRAKDREKEASRSGSQ